MIGYIKTSEITVKAEYNRRINQEANKPLRNGTSYDDLLPHASWDSVHCQKWFPNS